LKSTKQKIFEAFSVAEVLIPNGSQNGGVLNFHYPGMHS
jgi:hypothetical protein